jgi:nucleoside-diphosphate-sugar epimerase
VRGPVLVTGGAGFIGSHLVEKLVSLGIETRVLDSFETGRRENLASVEGKVLVLEGDIRDEETCARAVKGVEVVLHQAALPSVPRSVEEPKRSFEINVQGTNTLLLAARDAGVRRVVQASSSSVYGDAPSLPKHEDLPPAPRSPYAAQKLAAEQLGVAFTTSLGLEVVGLRYFNVFGSRQNPKSQYAAVVPRFTVALLDGEAPTIYGDGEQSRDFTHIDNVVEANLRAADAPKAAGSFMNIACGERTTLNDLFRLIAAAIGNTTLKPRYEPTRAGDVKHSLASIDRARELIGFEPRVTLEDGIRRTVEWYRRAR